MYFDCMGKETKMKQESDLSIPVNPGISSLLTWLFNNQNEVHRNQVGYIMLQAGSWKSSIITANIWLWNRSLIAHIQI